MGLTQDTPSELQVVKHPGGYVLFGGNSALVKDVILMALKTDVLWKSQAVCWEDGIPAAAWEGSVGSRWNELLSQPCTALKHWMLH